MVRKKGVTVKAGRTGVRTRRGVTHLEMTGQCIERAERDYYGALLALADAVRRLLTDRRAIGYSWNTKDLAVVIVMVLAVLLEG